MKCDNADRGCDWEGTVGMYEEHKARCSFVTVPCPKKCERQVTKEDLEHHLKNECPNRDYQCKHCGEMDTYIKIVTIHDNLCKKKIISCSNPQCTERMEQGEMANHIRKECEYTVVPCEYERIGCSVTMTRKDILSHEQDDKVHLHHALKTIKGLKKKIDSIKLRKGEAFTFKVSEYESKIKQDMIFFSEDFYTSAEGYRLRVIIYPNGKGLGKNTHISAYITTGLKEGEYDHKLKWPLTGSVTFELLNQLADKKHQNFTFDLDSLLPDSNKMRGTYYFIAHSQLPHNSTNNTQYLKDDTLYFRVSVEVANHKPWLECTT